MPQSVSWSGLIRCLAGALLDELAAHVAHEVNNPLAVISGTAEQLGNILHSPPGTEAALERVSEIVLRNANRMKATTRALQELARETNSAPYQEARLSTSQRK